MRSERPAPDVSSDDLQILRQARGHYYQMQKTREHRGWIKKIVQAAEERDRETTKDRLERKRRDEKAKAEARERDRRRRERKGLRARLALKAGTLTIGGPV